MILYGYLALLAVAPSCVLADNTNDKKKYYRAAVLEHVRFGIFSHSVQEILEKNFRTYEIAVLTAAQNDVDIIVFPEWGLYPHNKQNRSWVTNFAENIPDPKTGLFNPCIQADTFQKRPILRKLSCLAQKNNIFLLANIADAKTCVTRESCDKNEVESCSSKSPNCPEDGMLFHNTNVVFNREGTLIARYYKRHLFFEFDLNVPHLLEDAFFETDFGNFTTFICFDMMYKESVVAVKKFNVINVAYPTYWFDTAPFAYSATAYQQSWALTNKVNLLAANVHQPRSGTMGSGIYSATRGALTHTNNPDGRSKLLISNVPRFIEEREETPVDLNVKRFFIENDSTFEASTAEESSLKQTKCSLNISAPMNILNEYDCYHNNDAPYKFLKLKDTEGTLKSCTNNFCCHLSYESISMEEEYFLGAFTGDFVSNNAFSYGIETCFLTRCESSNNDRCSSYVTKSSTIFQTIHLQGDFTTEYIYPAVVDSDFKLTDKMQWHLNGKSKLVYNQLYKNASILFLGLTGRNYERDHLL